MLNCKVNKKTGLVKVKAGGKMDDLMPELLTVIGEVYRGIAKQNPEAAKVAKNTIIGTLIDPMSPVWRGEQG